MINFSTRFQDFDCVEFFRGFLPEDLLLYKEDLVKQTYQKYITNSHILGTIKSLNLSILEFQQTSDHDPRVSLAKEAFRIMADHRIRRGLVIFWNPQTKNWRLSLMTINLDIDEKNKIIRNYSNAKRFSFLLGEGEAMKTPRLQLSTRVKDFDDLQKRFSVEVVRKEFFDDYIDLFIRLYIEISKDESFIKVLSDQSIDRVKFTKNLLGKIIFVYFIQKKGWLGLGRDAVWGKGDQNFMRSLWNRFASGDTFVRPSTEYFYNDYLEHLFYNGFNKDRRDDDAYEPNMKMKVPYLNGGLFKEDYRDWEHFVAKISNDIFSNGKDGILDIFDTYNFTIDEDDLTDAEIAVDPEMLGKIFEKMISVSKDNIEEIVALYQEKGKVKIGTELNKKFGAFYTPREIVHYMTRESLVAYLLTNLSGKKEDNEIKVRQLIDAKDQHLSQPETLQLFGNDSANISTFTNEIDSYLQKVKIIDPAVGSGAFPMGILHEITTLRYYLHSEGFCSIHHIETEDGSENLTENGHISMYQIKRETIKNSIYGVDIEPGAIDIARLRFWLSLVVDAERPEPLPNFEFNFVCANTLVKLFDEDIGNQTQLSVDDDLKIERLKFFMKEYYNADTKKEKENIQANFQKYIAKKYRIDDNKQLALDGSFSQRQCQILNFNPFNNNHSNPFFDASLMMSIFRGFDIAIGNPPYVSSWKDLENSPQKTYYKENYKTAVGHYDLYILFYEKSINLLKKDGILSFITSNKWMAQGYGLELRKLFLEKKLLQLLDFKGYQVFESATVDTNITILKNEDSKSDYDFQVYTLTEDKLPDFYKVPFEKINTKIFRNDESFNFKLELTHQTLSVVNKMTLDALLLEEICYVSVGAVCHSDKPLKIPKSHFIFEQQNDSKELKPYIEGKNIQKWCISGFRYLNYQPKLFNQGAGFQELFESVKIVNKGTCGRGQLEFVLDTEGLYTNHKVNNIVPYHSIANISNRQLNNYISEEKIKHSNQYSLKMLLGVLNSKITTWYFLTLMSNGLDFYPSHLRNIPIPKINTVEKVRIFKNIEDNVSQIIRLKTQNSDSITKGLEQEIDYLVYQLYGLTDEEIEIIEKN